ncbi:unnamed protein product [Eretmochelys imbricata]
MTWSRWQLKRSAMPWACGIRGTSVRSCTQTLPTAGRGASATMTSGPFSDCTAVWMRSGSVSLGPGWDSACAGKPSGRGTAPKSAPPASVRHPNPAAAWCSELHKPAAHRSTSPAQAPAKQMPPSTSHAPQSPSSLCSMRRGLGELQGPSAVDVTVLCLSLSEPLAVSSSPSVRPFPPPPHIHTKYISEGRVITFRCGLNSSRPHLQVSWYKDGELLSDSVPSFKLLPCQELRVHATKFSEGQYTCLIRHASRILRAHSWQIKLKARSPSSHKQPGL